MTYARGSTYLPVFLPSPTAKFRAILYGMAGGLVALGLALKLLAGHPFEAPDFWASVLMAGFVGAAWRAARSGDLASAESAVARSDFRTDKLTWAEISRFEFDAESYVARPRLTATLTSGAVVTLMDLGSSSRQHDLGADYARTLERLRIIHTHMRPEFPQ